MFSHLLLTTVLLLSPFPATTPPALDNACPAVDQAALLPSDDAPIENKLEAEHDKAKLSACSGVTCGCDIDQQSCLEDCPPQGAEGSLACRMACNREYIACSKTCCGAS